MHQMKNVTIFIIRPLNRIFIVVLMIVLDNLRESFIYYALQIKKLFKNIFEFNKLSPFLKNLVHYLKVVLTKKWSLKFLFIIVNKNTI